MIELSADLGESAPREEEIWPLVDAASVACGGHTGDDLSMTAAILQASEHGVALGAHPSYPDREHFGRRTLAIAPHDLTVSLVEQISRLSTLAAAQGIALQRVKPHGALYNDAHGDRALAELVVESILAFDPTLALVCGSTSRMAEAARDAGLDVVTEAFADRRYRSDGSLVPRSEPGALLSVEESALQAQLLAAEGVVIASDGTRIPVAFETLCVHSDLEGAVERLRAIRQLIDAPSINR